MTEYVYIVTKGEYSDRYIAAVFDSEIEAKAYAKSIDGDFESYELNQVSPIPHGMKIYGVHYGREQWSAYIEADLNQIGRSRIRYYRYDDRYVFRTYCLARDRKHALKIGMERRGFMIATYGEVECEHDFGGRVVNND